MNEQSTTGGNDRRDEETLERLLRLAGPRPVIPAQVESRVYARVHQEWSAATQKPDGAKVYARVHKVWQRESAPNRARWFMPAALAATVLIALAVLMPPQGPLPAPATVAKVVKIVGGSGNGVSTGQDIVAGEMLQTSAQEGVSLLLASGASVRIDENTSVVFDARDRIALERGRIYADTGDFVYRNNRLIVDTPHGVVTDIGTQFAVQAADESLDVAVREGRVDVHDGNEEVTAVAGERLLLRNGTTDVEALAPHDAWWDWTAALAPTFEIEGKSLLEFLRWAARETGRDLVFSDNELRMSAMRTDLHGSVADLEPLDAVVSVLSTTRFRYRIESDTIVIER